MARCFFSKIRCSCFRKILEILWRFSQSDCSDVSLLKLR